MKRLVSGWLLFLTLIARAAEPPTSSKASGDGGVAPTAPAAKEDVSKLPFTPFSIKKILASHHDEIQNCYEDTMANRDQIIEGKLTAAFSIEADGTVRKARVLKKGTTLNDSKLHDCVISVLSAITFPKPPDHREHPVEYPFNLKAIR